MTGACVLYEGIVFPVGIKRVWPPERRGVDPERGASSRKAVLIFRGLSRSDEREAKKEERESGSSV